VLRKVPGEPGVGVVAEGVDEVEGAAGAPKTGPVPADKEMPAPFPALWLGGEGNESVGGGAVCEPNREGDVVEPNRGAAPPNNLVEGNVCVPKPPNVLVGGDARVPN
jgi:hypothetical protein